MIFFLLLMYLLSIILVNHSVSQSMVVHCGLCLVFHDSDCPPILRFVSCKDSTRHEVYYPRLPVTSSPVACLLRNVSRNTAYQRRGLVVTEPPSSLAHSLSSKNVHIIERVFNKIFLGKCGTYFLSLIQEVLFIGVRQSVSNCIFKHFNAIRCFIIPIT